MQFGRRGPLQRSPRGILAGNSRWEPTSEALKQDPQVQFHHYLLVLVVSVLCERPVLVEVGWYLRNSRHGDITGLPWTTTPFR